MRVSMSGERGLIVTNHQHLAFLVTITPKDRWGDTCVAWVESRGEQCGKTRSEGFLCPTHTKVAQRRLEKRQAKEAAYLARKQRYYIANRKQWQEQLAKVDAEIERRTGVLTTDRAAYGGVGVPAIEKHNLRQFSDSNVERVGELMRQKKDLEQKLRGIHGA